MADETWHSSESDNCYTRRCYLLLSLIRVAFDRFKLWNDDDDDRAAFDGWRMTERLRITTASTYIITWRLGLLTLSTRYKPELKLH